MKIIFPTLLQFHNFPKARDFLRASVSIYDGRIAPLRNLVSKFVRSHNFNIIYSLLPCLKIAIFFKRPMKEIFPIKIAMMLAVYSLIICLNVLVILTSSRAVAASIRQELFIISYFRLLRTN